MLGDESSYLFHVRGRGNEHDTGCGTAWRCFAVVLGLSCSCSAACVRRHGENDWRC